jgi:hypothetical protein
MLRAQPGRVATLTAAIVMTTWTLLLGQTQPAPPAVTVGGVAYAQYAYHVSDSANHFNNFDVTRAYLNVTGRFAEGLATRITGDIYRNADGSAAYRLKYAYAAYTPGASPLTFKLGLIHTALLDWEEALWDYRMQGTMPLERGGYVSSADFGAGVDGRWGGEQVNVQLAVVNGENYNQAPGDKGKDFQARASLRLMGSDDASRVGGLRVTGYAQLGTPTTGGTRNRFLGMVSYKSSLGTLAAEAGFTRTAVGTPAPAATGGQVLSAYGVYRFPGTRAALVGRVDLTDPNTDAAGDKATRIILGASYQLTPNLRMLADLDNVSYETTPANAALYAARSQALFQMQFTF